MNQRDMVHFVRRWKDVNRLEDQELREMTPETRMRRMLAAYRLAVGLGLSDRAGNDREGQAVMLRWYRQEGPGQQETPAGALIDPLEFSCCITKRAGFPWTSPWDSFLSRWKPSAGRGV